MFECLPSLYCSYFLNILIMQEFIDELQQKVGLTAEQAKKAIETIIEKVKTKVPEMLHGTIDSVFTAGSQKGEDLMQRAQEFARQAKDKAGEYADKAEDWAEDTKDKAEDIVKNMGDKLSGLFGSRSSENK